METPENLYLVSFRGAQRRGIVHRFTMSLPGRNDPFEYRHSEERRGTVIPGSTHIPSFRGAKRREILLFNRHCERFLPSVEMTEESGQNDDKGSRNDEKAAEKMAKSSRNEGKKR
ncbi:MAG: hypothetical protein M0Q23_01765 [Syntrophales bacterium]|nr:hypothetical protein [Syntrophales bacterium]MCK9527376.1 hypothetical protein [Syntrophales bacterium]MDX9921478.1 hypothetical protein [Syntrophales bacterium]